MAASGRFRLSSVIACLALLLGSGFAQRPNTASLCDFYAQARYGANSSETQLKFIQNVVCLAFEGGSRLNNVSSDITGILRPGKYNGIDINLLQYFNGSRASTNVNNAPIGINWLDQGGATPLAAFLAGESLVLAATSNQYHLFSNFFVAFSRAFGCTLPPAPLPNTNGPVGLAYAHKFMGLENHQLGYFINHLSLAAVHFGMSLQDADTFRTSLNSRYNVRCAPGVSFSPNSPPQLLSLCQNQTCPLAVPVSDCAAYANLTAGGVANSNPTTVTSFATKTAAPSGTGEPASSSAAATSADSAKLGTGAIAGIAIGGAAVLLIAIIALVYFLRKRKPAPSVAPEQTPTAAWVQQNHGSSTGHPESTYSPKNHHLSYHSNGQPPSEMESSRYQNLTNASSPIASPAPTAQQGYRPHSGHPNENWGPAPVEMDSTRSVSGVQGPYSVPHDAVWSEPLRQNDSTPRHDQEHYSQQQWRGVDRHSGM
ncbi:hypothetical protein GQ44DRAFT_656497 [Phaeosphaeriaceae sp. PMI808]|nr:hypothetical protein GQ44DRAFT_656497 [Phaeosphaeriaceae sp. PMI808]